MTEGFRSLDGSGLAWILFLWGLRGGRQGLVFGLDGVYCVLPQGVEG